MPADPWQAELLRSSARRMLLLCGRQCGKSTTASALALKAALLEPPALVLLLSPTLRQSGELFRDKLLPLWRGLGRPLLSKPPTQLTLELSNGSRIVSLPSSPDGIRGYSGVRLLIVDEASRVPDELYNSVRPMLAVSQGKLVCLTTPAGQRGFFFDEWHSTHVWERVRITADQCPRIDPQFLEEEKEAIGERWFRQEYMCSFEDLVGSLLSTECIMASISDEVKPMFSGS